MDDLRAEAKQIASKLKSELDEKNIPKVVDVDHMEDLEIVALIAYLKSLGTDIIPDNK